MCMRKNIRALVSHGLVAALAIALSACNAPIGVSTWDVTDCSGMRGVGSHFSAGADGQMGKMAFVSRQCTTNHIYLMSVNASGVGSNPTRLTTDAEAENYPSWSPDGKTLVYQRDLNGAAIYVIK